jgi:hypothetical protein
MPRGWMHSNPGGMMPNIGNLRTPLEGVDLAADMVNRVATLPGAVVGDMVDAVGDTIKSLKNDIAMPREQPERPIPPDKLISPIPKAVGDAVGGAIDTVRSGVDAVVQNVEGARRELENFVRG